MATREAAEAPRDYFHQFAAAGNLPAAVPLASRPAPPTLAASRPLHACTAMKRPCVAGNGRAAAPARASGGVRRESHPPALAASRPLHARTAKTRRARRQRSRRGSHPRLWGNSSRAPPPPVPARGECVARARPPSPRHLRCWPRVAVRVHRSRATEVTRLPPARAPHVSRSAPFPTHAGSRPLLSTAAVCDRESRATDVTRLPPARMARASREPPSRPRRGSHPVPVDCAVRDAIAVLMHARSCARASRTIVPWSHSLWVFLPFFCSAHGPPTTHLHVQPDDIACSTSALRSRSPGRASARSASTRNASRAARFPLGAGAAQAGRPPPATRATAARSSRGRRAGVRAPRLPPRPACCPFRRRLTRRRLNFAAFRYHLASRLARAEQTVSPAPPAGCPARRRICAARLVV
jgi:hypothetical protein